jgi:hypothetical protein
MTEIPVPSLLACVTEMEAAAYRAGQRDMQKMAAHEMQLRIDFYMAKNSDAPMNYFSAARGVILALEIKDAQ